MKASKRRLNFSEVPARPNNFFPEFLMKKSVEKILLGFDPNKKNLLPALREINSEWQFISEENARKTAEYFEIPLSEVFETASFYDLIKTEDFRGTSIEVCFGNNCCVSGSKEVIGEIEKYLGIREGDESDPRFRLRKMSCVGMCGSGPVVKIKDKLYTKVAKEDVSDILKEYC